MKARLFLLSLLACFGYFTMGVTTTWPSTGLPSIRSSLPLSVEQQSWIGSLPSFGGVLGSIGSGVLARKLGPRLSLIVTYLVSLLAWILVFLSSFLQLLPLLYPGLLLLGVSFGVSNPVTSIYVSEIAGSGNKGTVTSLFNFSFTFGLLFVNILGVLVSWFYTSLVFCILNAVISLIAILKLSKTPYEVARLGDKERVQDLLSDLRESEKQELEQEVTDIFREVEERDQRPGHLVVLRQVNVMNLAVVLMVTLFCHLSGISIISTYLVDMFSVSTISPLVLVMVASFSEMGSSFFQMLIADMLGRKTFLIICGLGTSLSSLMFSAVFWISTHPEQEFLGSSFLHSFLSSNILTVLLLTVYFCSYNLGFGPIKHTLLSELFSPMEQETVAGLLHTTYWLSAFLIVKMFHFLVLHFGLSAIFVSISAVCLGSVFFTVFVIPETRITKKKEGSGS